MGVKTKQAQNQYLHLQGRQFALDLVHSFGQQLYSAKGIAEAMARLTKATANKPESYAVGITDIVDVLRVAAESLAQPAPAAEQVMVPDKEENNV